jgi:hypothetical protein
MYRVIVANDGTEYIPDAGITYGKHTLKFGNVMPNGSKGYGTVTLPIPGEVTIVWRQESARAFEKRVSVKSLIPNPSKFDGAIWLRLQDDGSVTIEVKK